MTYRIHTSEFNPSFLGWLKAKFEFTESHSGRVIDLELNDNAEIAMRLVGLIGSVMFENDEDRLHNLRLNIIYIAYWI